MAIARNMQITEYHYSLLNGKCAVTGEEFSSTHEIHCHHKLPRYLGGDDSYGNLILVKDSVHKLIHAINADTIAKYLELLQLDKSQLKR